MPSNRQSRHPKRPGLVIALPALSLADVLFLNLRERAAELVLREGPHMSKSGDDHGRT